MDFLKQRHKTRQRITSKITILCLAILLMILVRPTWKIFQKSLESKNNLSRAESELSKLESRKQELEASVSYIKTDYGRDQEIRSKFGVAKDGETMMVIVRDIPGLKEPEPIPSVNWFRRMWAGFLEIIGLE